jgi:hypothetical protein
LPAGPSYFDAAKADTQESAKEKRKRNGFMDMR